MNIENKNFIGRCYCPECNCIYIIIDNEIISCPVCELRSNQKVSEVYEDKAGKVIVQDQI